MLKLGVQQSEDIAKWVGPARDVHPSVRSFQPMEVQNKHHGPTPNAQSPPRVSAPSSLHRGHRLQRLGPLL